MKKNTFWFYHDYHARTDIKLLTLIRKKGWEGYGLYWAVIEKLHEAGGWLNEDLEPLAYELRADIDCITAVIREFSLFIFKNKRFSSTRVLDNLRRKEKASETARDNVNKRWNKEHDNSEGKGYARITTVEPSNNNGNTPEILGEERRGEEKREEKKKTTDSRTPSGAARDVALPPKEKKTAETATAGNDTIPHWQETLDYIDQAWVAKKRSKGVIVEHMYIPENKLRSLKNLMRIHPAHETMALFDSYLGCDARIAIESGHGLAQFISLATSLVDSPTYEQHKSRHQKRLKGELPVELNVIGGKS